MQLSWYELELYGYLEGTAAHKRAWDWHFSLSWNWEIIFFLSNNYKPILGVGKGKNFRNANLQIRTNVIVMMS